MSSIKSESHEENSALQGVRVIDLTHFMAGPACTQKLADLGADVIKVEPETGEFTRVWSIGDAFVQTESTSYHALNRNKRSIVLNAKDPDDYAALRKLITTADVFIQNFRPGVSDRLKLDYETLKASNPRLIYCAISGYGQSGPNRDRPGQDLLIQAFSGLPWNSGAADDPPVAAGSFIADSAAGNLAAIGILSALLARQRTGKGQKVEVSLLGALMDLQIQELTAFMNAGVEPKRQPERLAHPLLNGPYGLHRTADGWVAMSTTPLDVLAEALECPPLRQFEGWGNAYRHRSEIFRIVAAQLSTRPTAHWLDRLPQFGVWCGPVNRYADLLSDPQVEHLGAVSEVEHEKVGKLKLVSFPVSLSDTPARVRTPGPALGQHTAEILASLADPPPDDCRSEELEHRSRVEPRNRTRQR
jgi:crotonobetainyl-CoA:carnitine CoA-transferase CaiB-like acyl-CoA transferase